MGKKILIIDDSEDICFAISEFFKLKGWIVNIAFNIEEALKKVKEGNNDIILVDYNMPQINGVIGVKLIRQLDENVTIIALTIENDETIAEEFFSAGVNDFAIKPIKMLDLFCRINAHLVNTKKEKIKIEYPKGIDKNTLFLIEYCLKNNKEYLDVEEISLKTGIANKTVNRYVNYLLDEDHVLLDVVYGKVGRPKKKYLWK